MWCSHCVAMLGEVLRNELPNRSENWIGFGIGIKTLDFDIIWTIDLLWITGHTAKGIITILNVFLDALHWTITL